MANITDKKPKLTAPFAHAVIAPRVTKAAVQLGGNSVNPFNDTSKKLGSCVVCTDVGAGHALLMAEGYSWDAKWQSLGTATELTVAGTAPSAPTFITDRKPKVHAPLVGALDFPIVSEADAKSGDAAINSDLWSGKRFGAAIIIERTSGDHMLFIADGYNPTSKWHGIDGATIITPTAATTVTPDLKTGDKKPKAKQSVVAAVPFPCVTKAQLEKKADRVNSTDGTVSGKQAGSMVVASDSGTPVLFMALGYSDVSKWVLLKENDTTGAVTPA